jgi:hypothetical protein
MVGSGVPPNDREIRDLLLAALHGLPADAAYRQVVANIKGAVEAGASPDDCYPIQIAFDTP